MSNIECEVRAMIDDEKFTELLAQFKETFTYIGIEEQITYYFDGENDLRIQQSDNSAKVWLKKGKLHDEHREEIEIKVPKEDFEKLEQLFLALDYNIAIKWFRTRHTFRWDDIDVTLDFTRGYGYIIELEKISNEEEQEATISLLKQKLASLGITQTAREEFDEKYRYYKANWKELTAPKR